MTTTKPPAAPGHRQMPISQPFEAGPMGQRHRWDQPGERHQTRIIEHCRPGRRSMR
jgi:hypothetical protein